MEPSVAMAADEALAPNPAQTKVFRASRAQAGERKPRGGPAGGQEEVATGGHEDRVCSSNESPLLS